MKILINMPIKASLLLLSIFCFSLIPQTAQAQAPWEVLILETQTGKVLRVTSTAIEPQVELVGLTEFGVVNDVRMSPDGKFIAFGGIKSGVSGYGIYLANLETGECCSKVPEPFPSAADFADNGGFSPDSSHLVAAFSKTSVADATVDTLGGFLATYDLATQQLDQVIPLTDVPNSDENTLGAYLGTWSEAGIDVFPTCMACNRPISGQFSRWNPADGSFSASGALEFFGDKLPETNEIVVAKRDEGYDLNGALSNVVMYYAPDAIQPVAIYYNPNYLQIEDAHWVMNGAAVLVEHFPGGTTFLVGRDGQPTLYELAPNTRFIAATPDGWLMQSDGEILYYQVTNGELVTKDLGPIVGDVILLTQPAFSEVADPTFAPLP